MKRFIGALLFCVALLAAAPAMAEGSTDMGILIAAFGTAVPEARKDYELMQAAVEARYPGVPVFWGYTAKQVRAKVRAMGQEAPSVEETLARMADQGIRKIAVLALYVSPGQEYHDMARICQIMATVPKGLDAVRVSAPLLYGAADARQLAQTLANAFSASKGGVVFVGHGARSGGSLAYAALAHYLGLLNPRFKVGVIEGEPGVDAAFSALSKEREITLVPLLVVAGDHARNDIGGKEESMASTLRARGVRATVLLQGLPRIPQVRDMWLERLDVAVRALNAE